MGSQVDTKKYRYLEARPHKWKQQFWIKGRNMTVWNLVASMRTNGDTPEIAASCFRLPIEAVQEALDYYQQNQELIHSEVTEEGRRLREAGLLKD
jgi:uncharacterized protein (DUF433 family)